MHKFPSMVYVKKLLLVGDTMVNLGTPLCAICKHYNSDLKCLAFPDGIPWDILVEQHNHRKPYIGDCGVQFEPNDSP